MERKDIVLNNGVTMPPIGYGVFRMTEWLIFCFLTR